MRGRPVQPVRGIDPERVKLRWCGDAKAMEPVCGCVSTFAGGVQGLNCSGMTMPEAKRLRELDTENARPKKPLAESMLEIEITREAL
jgi:hypothetical protein